MYPVVVSASPDHIHSILEAAVITFKDLLLFTWYAPSESMLIPYLVRQVLFAAWQAVHMIVPTVRNYDLEMVKQAPLM